MFYKLRSNAGKHQDEAGNTYEAGDVVESEANLADMFPNKFLKLTESTGKKLMAKAEKKEEKGKKLMKGKARARLDDDERIAEEHGEEPEEDETEDGDEEGAEDEEEEEEDDTDDADEEHANPLGKDVTDQFPKAGEADLLVFKKGKNFSVAEKDEPEKSLNKKGLAKKADVEKFVKSHK